MGKANRDRIRRRQFVETGHKYEAPDINRMDQALKETPALHHLWMMNAAWKVSATQMESPEPIHFDAENLLITTVGCYKCEKPYTPERSTTACTGMVP